MPRADRVSIEALSASQELRRWSWIAPDGKEVAGDEQELVSRLKKGELPPTTLVWQRTWLEWVPALRVAALASAFPKRRSEPPLEPKRSPTAVVPPARPPLPTLTQGSVVLPPAAPGAGKGALPTSFGSLGRARGPSVLGPHRTEALGNTHPPRPVLNTLADEPAQNRSTLRPPGAIPPPPRAVPSPNFDLTPSRIRNDAEALTRRQNALPSEKDTVFDPRTPSSALPSELRQAVVVPGAAREERVAEKPASNPKALDVDLDATLGSTPFEVTAQDFVDLPPPSTTLESPGPAPGPDSTTVPPARKAARPLAKKPSLSSLMLVAMALGLGTFVLVKLAVHPKNEELPKPATPPGPQATAERATAAPAGCGIVQPAARLAASIHRPVAPLVTAPLDAARASVGFAESENDAAGLGVDLVTLDVERAFTESGKKPVRFVVPLALDAKRFVADRDDEKLAALRTLDTEPRVAIGVHGGDWVRTQGRSTGVLWPGQAAEKTTDPRVASGPTGHLVTFRRGGLSGQVLVGFLAPDGSARGELQVIEAPGVKLVGTPDGAVSGSAWLVGFAGRGSPEEEWRVVLASGKLDGGKPSVRSFTTPPGGAGGSSIAPSVSGLGDGGFVLQWTEGKSAQYQVRVQRLNAELEGVGEPLLVSPKGANAGQGTVFARGPRVLSLFVQTTAGHDELWGTSLECP
jgi:hypothetical protein